MTEDPTEDLLRNLELPPFAPSQEFMEKVWTEVSRTATHPTKPTGAPRPTDRPLSRRVDLQTPERRADRRQRTSWFAGALVAAASLIVAVYVSMPEPSARDVGPTASEDLDAGLEPPAQACAGFLATTETALGEPLTLEAVRAADDDTVHQIVVAADVFLASADLADLERQALEMRVLAAGLRRAAEAGEPIDSPTRQQTIDVAMANVADDWDWHASGPLDGCFSVDD